MRPSVLLGVATSIAWTALSTPARAADGGSAEALFLEGRRAVQAGNYAAACPMFEESNRLDPSPGALLNLADCEDHRGQIARSWLHFRELHDELPAGDERRALAESRALALAPRIPRLRIVLTSPVPARVERDDVVLGPASLGASERVDPGRHVVLVSSPGRLEQRYVVEIAEGEAQSLSVSPGEPLPSAGAIVSPPPPIPEEPARPAPRPADEPARHDGGPMRTAALVLGGFGAASMLTGGVFGAAALSQLSSSNARCQGNVCASQDGINQFHSAQSLAVIADVTLGVGLACVVTAVVMAVTSRPGSTTTVAAWPLGLQGRF